MRLEINDYYKNKIFISIYAMTRQDIFDKRTDTWVAEFDGFSIYHANCPSEKYQYGSVRMTTIDQNWLKRIGAFCSIYDILFWPSNFFEVMFWEKVIDASEHCPREPRQCCCWHWLTETEYHKMQCAIAKDRLAYLVDNLSK